MKLLMKPFCRVAHAGTSPTEGIDSLPQPPDEMWDEKAPWRRLPEQPPCLGTCGFPPDKPPGPASIPGMPRSFISKDPSFISAWLRPVSPISQ